MRHRINEISPSFCIAKWLQVTLDLVHGENHSCHHPLRQPISLSDLKEPSKMHNTDFKKARRKEMLEGVRPKECSYCWNIEDSSSTEISDRLIKSTDEWAYPHLKEVLKASDKENINPTYMEVMFSKTCNLSCSYCMADISSSIEAEIKKFGPIPVQHEMHRSSQKQIRYSDNPDKNPYLKAFWQWFPDLIKDLEVFRITGGEPLLSENTFKVFDYLEAHPQPKLVLSINSNLSLPEHLIEKLFKKVENLLTKNAIAQFELYASIDTVGEQASFIRSGLCYQTFIQNIEKFCKKFPQSKCILMCTYNILSIPKFHLLLEELIRLKKDYKDIVLDISYLKDPSYLSPKIINKPLLEKVNKDLVFMQKNHEYFSDYEIGKFKRIYYWIKHAQDHTAYKYKPEMIDFYIFIKEFSKRKKKDFQQIFPELAGFYNLTHKLFIEFQMDKNRKNNNQTDLPKAQKFN